MPEILLDVRALTAFYGDFQALFGVSLSVEPGIGRYAPIGDSTTTGMSRSSASLLSALGYTVFLLTTQEPSPDEEDKEKEKEQPYLLAPSTNILDDYFFVHREVLVWKFLASACKQDKGKVECPVKQRAKFATMNPHEHSSAPATIEYLGREKITLKGAESEFNKLELKGESGTWLLWLDDQFKVQRILISDENTEVLRD